MTATELPGQVTLSEHGIESTAPIYRNPTTALLYTHALARRNGKLAEGGPLAVDTGKFTGRSPKDKFLVDEASSRDRIWWGEVNQPLAEDNFDRLRDKVTTQLEAADALYVIDAWAGADPAHRIGVRVITAHPYHALFAKTMFIDLTSADELTFTPQALVLHTPDLEADPAEDGTRTGTFIVLHPGRTELLVGGTFYAGEIKKSIFTVMNDRLPLEGVFPMHCSANVGEDGTVAVFFGLSGTGKTTLSADPERKLIGDDEHGWGDSGVFNIEGGCYAKVIHLSPTAEPEIYKTTRTFGTILENVAIDEQGIVDLDDAAKTENTRAAYKLEQIANALPAKLAGHPKSVIFLTADAFGILPPIAKLSNAQALYFFLSGFTAKLEEHGSTVWLLNTGWTGGPFGEGERMPIQATRTMLSAALSGFLQNAKFRVAPLFGFEVPTAVPGVDTKLLDPRATWRDPEHYDRKARELAQMFVDNFAKRFADVGDSVQAAGPRL
jgi:phosphoenolpyruvate carboxykinase (ATP)